MRQTLMIDRVETGYSITEKAVKSVLGENYIARTLLYNDALRILYAGLQNQRGYSEDEFIAAIRSGQIYALQRLNQVPLTELRAHIRKRIKVLNEQAKEYRY